MQRFAAFCLRKNGAIIFTTVLLPFYYHEIAENSVNTVPFAAICHALSTKIYAMPRMPWQTKSTLVTVVILPKCRSLQRFAAFCRAYLSPLYFTEIRPKRKTRQIAASQSLES